jgi:hypothetical protein
MHRAPPSLGKGRRAKVVPGMSTHSGGAGGAVEARGWQVVGEMKDVDGRVIAWTYTHPEFTDYELQVNSDFHPLEPRRFVHTVATPGHLGHFEIGAGDVADIGAYLDDFRDGHPRVRDRTRLDPNEQQTVRAPRRSRARWRLFVVRFVWIVLVVLALGGLVLWGLAHDRQAERDSAVIGRRVDLTPGYRARTGELTRVDVPLAAGDHSVAGLSMIVDAKGVATLDCPSLHDKVRGEEIIVRSYQNYRATIKNGKLRWSLTQQTGSLRSLARPSVMKMPQPDGSLKLEVVCPVPE